ncbi:MAG: DUF1491 family protein [Pseudomonadota bacterium]
MEPRLPTQLWVKARLALWNQQGYPAVLRRRGDDHGGTIIICVDRCNGTSILLGQRRDFSGAIQWAALGSGEAMAAIEETEYLERATKIDRDIWVLGVEAARDWPPLDEPVVQL